MLKRFFIATMFFALTVGVAHAGEYVSWAKGYRITYPDNWQQIERYNVENFFRLHGKEDVEFDVFLCPEDAVPFYSQAYVVASADTAEVAQWMIDSIMAGLKNQFTSIIAETGSMGGTISEAKPQAPVYDAKTRTITQVSRINSGGQMQMMSLFVKFYATGIAYLYCYTAETNYSKYKDTFKAIADSFSDKGLDSIEDTTSMKVKQIEQSTPSENGDESNGSGTSSSRTWLIGGALALLAILGAFLIRRRKR